jgi:ChpA-C
VSVSLENTTVQIPVSVAANVCDVNVAALARLIAIGPTTCDATSSSGATVPLTVGGAGPTTQTGLVNVALTNTTIQVPISAAANICGVDVAVLAVLASPTGASCTATSHSNAGG